MLDFLVYAVVFGTTLSVVALCLEHLAVIRGKPRRMHWLLAMLCSVLLPPLLALNTRPALVAAPAFLEPAPARSAPAMEGAPAYMPEESLPLLPAPSSATKASSASGTWRLPTPSRASLLLAWVAVSGALTSILVGTGLLLRRRSTQWQRALIRDREVLVSEDTGPALIGALRPQIVVPRWLMDEPVETQALVLQHEQQHIAARDPLLLRAAMLMAIATPWNLPLWWQLHRLRLAIELDCDGRVMASGAEAARYGEVLLGVTRRAARMPVGAVAMSEPVSALERRIRSLLPVAGRHSRLRMIGALLVAGAGVSAAAALEAPALGVPQATPPEAPATAAPSASPPAAATASPAGAGQKMSEESAAQLRLAFAMDAVIDDRPRIGGQVNPNFGKRVCRITRDGTPAARTNQILDPEALETLKAIAKDCKPVELLDPVNVFDRISQADKDTAGVANAAPSRFSIGTCFGCGSSQPAGVPDGAKSTTAIQRPDPDVIPSNLIDRMNVVTGGASATYGSGAMAGVVNMVLNNRLKGFKLDLDEGAQPSPDMHPLVRASFIAQRLKEAEQRLEELRQRFNDKHPEVVAQKKLVDDLRAQESGRPWARPASNPMELRALINEMSEQWGWRFVIDPRVQGSVDRGNLNPNNPDSLTYHAFLEILGVHGFVAIRSDDLVTIVPGEFARSIATPTIRLDSREGFYMMGDDAEVVTALIPIGARDGGMVNAQLLAKSLAPLVSRWGYLAETQDGKSLLMVDKVANVKRIADLAWGGNGKD